MARISGSASIAVVLTAVSHLLVGCDARMPGTPGYDSGTSGADSASPSRDMGEVERDMGDPVDVDMGAPVEMDMGVPVEMDMGVPVEMDMGPVDEDAGVMDAGRRDGGRRDAGGVDMGRDLGAPVDMGRDMGRDAGSTGPVDGGGGAVVRDHLLFEADFEDEEDGDPFYQFSNSQHCCDHSVTQSSAHARNGMYSFRAEVRRDDPSVSSGYRAEIEPLGTGGDSGEKWYGWSIYFETPTSGDNWTGTNGHYVQWHPNNSFGSASLGLWSYGGYWDLHTNPSGGRDTMSHTDTLVGDDVRIPANRWIDIVFHVNWETGLVEVWVDGEQYFDVMDSAYMGQYFKFGINRWSMTNDWVIYYDCIRIGDSGATYEDVAP